MASSEITITNVFPMRKRRAVGLGLTGRRKTSTSTTTTESENVERTPSKTPVSKASSNSKKSSTKSPLDANFKQPSRTPTRSTFSPASAHHRGRLRKTPQRLAAWRNNSPYDSGPEIVWDNDSHSPTFALDPGKSKRLVSKKSQDQLASILKKLSNEKNPNAGKDTSSNLFDAWMKKDDLAADKKNDRLIGKGCRKKRSVLNRIKLNETQVNQRVTRKRARMTSCNATRFQEQLSNFIKNINETGENDVSPSMQGLVKICDSNMKTETTISKREVEGCSLSFPIKENSEQQLEEEKSNSYQKCTERVALDIPLKSRETSKKQRNEDHSVIGLEDDVFDDFDELGMGIETDISQERNAAFSRNDARQSENSKSAIDRKTIKIPFSNQEIFSTEIIQSKKPEAAIDLKSDLNSKGSRMVSSVSHIQAKGFKDSNSGTLKFTEVENLSRGSSVAQQKPSQLKRSKEPANHKDTNGASTSPNSKPIKEKQFSFYNSNHVSIVSNVKKPLKRTLKSEESSKPSQRSEVMKDTEILLTGDFSLGGDLVFEDIKLKSVNGKAEGSIENDCGDFLDDEFDVELLELNENISPKVVQKDLGTKKCDTEVRKDLRKEISENGQNRKGSDDVLMELDFDFDDIDLELEDNRPKSNKKTEFKKCLATGGGTVVDMKICSTKIDKQSATVFYKTEKSSGVKMNSRSTDPYIPERLQTLERDIGGNNISSKSKVKTATRKDVGIIQNNFPEDDFDIELDDNDGFVQDCFADDFPNGGNNGNAGNGIVLSVGNTERTVGPKNERQAEVNYTKLGEDNMVGDLDFDLDDWTDENFEVDLIQSKKIELPNEKSKGVVRKVENVHCLHAQNEKHVVPSSNKNCWENRQTNFKIAKGSGEETANRPIQTVGNVKLRTISKSNKDDNKTSSTNRFRFRNLAGNMQSSQNQDDSSAKVSFSSFGVRSYGQYFNGNTNGHLKSVQRVENPRNIEKNGLKTNTNVQNALALNVSEIAVENNPIGECLETAADENFWNDANISAEFNTSVPFTSTQKCGLQNDVRNQDAGLVSKSRKYTAEDIERKKAEAKRKLELRQRKHFQGKADLKKYVQ